jgi:anti-sigma B factor antagonist
MHPSLFVRRRSPHPVVEVTGDIDLNSGPWLQEQLLRILRASGHRLLVDLSGVSFIDCSGLRMLLATCRSAEQQACSVSFIAVSGHVRRLAELTGLPEAIPLTAPSPCPAAARYAEYAAQPPVLRTACPADHQLMIS